MRVSNNLMKVCSALALLALLASCSRHAVVSTAEPGNLAAPEGMTAFPVAGYTTTDGVFHQFDGTVRVAGDSLEFYAPGREARGLELAKPEKSFKLALVAVTSVKARGR